MTAFPWLSMIVFSPLLAAMILLFLPSRTGAVVRLVAVLSTVVSLLGSLFVAWTFAEGGGVQLRESYDIVPSLGIALRFGVDGWGVSLLLLTSLIIFAGTFATWTLQDRAKDFIILLLALVCGVYGVFVSLDLFVFFLFYEIAVLPMYLLIGVWGSTKKVLGEGPFKFTWALLDVGGKEYAAMKLTLMLMGGSALILVALLGIYFDTGLGSFDMLAITAHGISPSVQMWAFPAIWIGFGTLAGVFPFHTWSPDGHASAPTAVSMLHAGVLMKLGAFGVMRIGMVMLPDAALVWAPWVGGVAALNIVWGAFCALRQTDLKYIIAYSSVSHMGVVMLGAATLSVDGWNGAIYQMFAHGLMTGMFFALVGLVYDRAHDREIFNMGGFAAKMPAVAVCFTLAGLSSLGMPGLAGFVAELLVFLGAWKSGHPVWAIAGILGAFITAVYVLRATRAIFWGEGPPARFDHLHDPKGTEWVALVVLGAALVVFGLVPRLILDDIDVATGQHLAGIEALGPVKLAGGQP